MRSQREERITSPNILPHDVHDILTSDPFLATLNIDAVAPITGGVAHRVYRIESGRDAYYLKIRGDRFTSIPTITCNPDDITHEYHALASYAAAAPNHFPQVHSFNRDRHYLVLSDVIKNGSKLDQVLAGGRVPKGLFGLYGQTLAAIKQKTDHITEPVRPDGDETYYHTVLGHRFGYRNHPVLNAAVDNLSRLPNRHLILGDPAPKNMGFRPKKQLLTFFDLETAHQGNPEFDYAYGLAHTMLHTMPNIDTMQQGVHDFVSGYGKTSYDSKLIYQLTLGLILYRLHSIIPYPVALSDTEKTIMEAHTEQELPKITGKESWLETITRLTNI